MFCIVLEAAAALSHVFRVFSKLQQPDSTYFVWLLQRQNPKSRILRGFRNFRSPIPRILRSFETAAARSHVFCVVFFQTAVARSHILHVLSRQHRSPIPRVLRDFPNSNSPMPRNLQGFRGCRNSWLSKLRKHDPTCFAWPWLSKLQQPDPTRLRGFGRSRSPIPA